ncbi:maltoporin [Oxalobacteraceae bacterium GrIS 1.11]
MSRHLMKTLPAALALALSASAASAALPIDFGGYLRSGFGTSGEGGKEACFGLAGASSKYRLGNECETYGELKFGGEAFKAANGTTFRINTLVAFSVNQNQDWEQSNPSWREMNVVADNIGSGAFAKAKAWVGKRYYERQDVHISDYYFWNNSGPGAGLENIDLGPAKLAYAIVRNADTNYGTAGTTPAQSADSKRTAFAHDIRFSGIKVNPDGELTVGVQINQKRNAPDATPIAGGHLLTLMHTQGNLLGGFNKVALQYGTGSAANTGGISLGAGSDDKVTRLTEQLMIQPKGDWSGMATFVYEDKQTAGVHSKWTSAGARPVYHFADNYSIAAELGFDQVKPDGQPTRNLTKFTIAPQLAAGNSFWSRPVLRAFYTYAKWNGAAQAAAGAGDALSTTGVFGSKTNGSSVGFQVEAWW